MSLLASLAASRCEGVVPGEASPSLMYAPRCMVEPPLRLRRADEETLLPEGLAEGVVVVKEALGKL
jgi:hypothetical protein